VAAFGCYGNHLYQRSKIQEEEVCYYENSKAINGEYCRINWVNTFLSSKGSLRFLPIEVIRATEEKKRKLKFQPLENLKGTS